MKQITFSTTTPSDAVIDIAFLPTNKTWQSKPNTNGRFIESGEHLVEHLVKAINDAKNMICFTSFIFQKGAIVDALEKAAERGVKIFVLTSDMRVTQQKLYDIGDEHQAVKGFKDLLNQQMRHRALVRMASNIHAKYLLVDPKSANAKGFLATCNFTEKAAKENPELVTVLKKEETTELFKSFVWHFWEATTDEQDAKDFKKVKKVSRFSLPSFLSILQTSTAAHQHSIRDYCLHLIQSAQSKIVFSTFGFDISHELGQVLLKKCKEGVTVEILARNRSKAINGNLEKLAKAGAKIVTHRLLHAKFLATDEQQGAIFTANFEKHGMDEGMEVGLKLSQQDIKELGEIIKHWQATFSHHIKVNVPVVQLPSKYFVMQKKLIPKTIKNKEQGTRTIQPQNLNEVIKVWSKKDAFDKESIKEYNFELTLNLQEKSIDELMENEKELTPNIYLGKYTEEQSKGKVSKKVTKEAILLTEGADFSFLSKFTEYKNLPVFALKL